MEQSSIELNKTSISDINLVLPKKSKKKKKKELQRTEKWRKERLGRWTGSQLKNLMSCSPGKGRLKWDNIDKLFSFGEAALKYIYENAMERKTGRYIDNGEGTLSMKYGTIIEPLIRKEVERILKERKIKGKVKEVGFKKFKKVSNAGVSSDSILVLKGKTVATIEMKACSNWQTHYDRTFELTSEKSKDFWQLQGECEAHEVDTCYYAVAEPPNDITKYVFHQGNIMDLYDEWKKECKVNIEIVKKSQLHVNALLKRIIIAEDALNDWLSGTEKRLDVTLKNTIEYYNKNPEKFDNYIEPIGSNKITNKFKK